MHLNKGIYIFIYIYIYINTYMYIYMCVCVFVYRLDVRGLGSTPRRAENERDAEQCISIYIAG